MMRILLVEDDKRLAEAMEQILVNEGFEITTVNDGQAAYETAHSHSFDLIVLDLMLPRMDGLSVTRALREESNDTNIIMVTAKGEIDDRINGLNAGADDYLPKPFHPKELIARINALTRRQNAYGFDGKVAFEDLTFDSNTGVLSTEEESVALTGKELELMTLFMEDPYKIYSKEKIIEKVWNGDPSVDGNNVEAYISFLRKKLSFIDSNVKIKAIRKVGYQLTTSA